MNALKSLIPPSVRSGLREIQDRVRPLLHVGNRVECPCCGAKYRKFLPTGRPERNALCPRCDSVERHRLLMLFLRDRTNLFTDQLRVLHFAPEKFAADKFAKLPNLKYVTTDYCERAHLNSDICKLPFRDETFDVVLSMHVLEHIPDDHTAMSEIRRVLSPQGWAILQVPLDLRLEHTYEDWSITTPEGRQEAFGQHDHVRWYGRDYGDRLRNAGLTVQRLPYSHEIGAEAAKRYGLDQNEDVYYCQK